MSDVTTEAGRTHETTDALTAAPSTPEPEIDVERHAEAIRAVFSGDNDHLTVGELRVRLASKDRA